MNYLEKELLQLFKTDRTFLNQIRIFSSDAIWYKDLENHENEWISSDFWDTLGYNADEISYTSSAWQDIAHPDDVQTFTESLRQHQQDPEHPLDVTIRFKHKNNLTVWMRRRGTILSNGKGKPTRMVGTFCNVTPLKEKEEKLSIEARQFKGAFDYAAIGMALVSPEGKWLRVNKSLCAILGYSEQELLQISFQDITHPDDLELDLEYVSQMLDGQIKHYDMEKRYFHKDGHVIWINLNVSLVKDSSGNPLHFVSQIQDITPKIKSREIFKNLLESAPDAMVIVNNKGEIELVNSRTVSLFGYPKKELIGMPVELLIPSRYVDSHQRHKNQYYKNPQARAMGSGMELFARGSNGLEFPVEISLSPMETEDGVLVSAAIRDVTEKKQIEQSLRQIASLKSMSREMEQFAYIASHDLREPLMTIKNYLDLFTNEYQSQLNEEAHQWIKAVIKAAERMDQLILGLLDYSRLSRIKPLQKIDCQDMVQSVIEGLNSLIEPAHAQIVVEKLPTIKAYPRELRLLFQHLIQNAIKFRNPDKPLSIKIGFKKVEKGWSFYIKDNGIGISAKDHEKIFEIFRKLHPKNTYEGIGIGLAHAKKITEIHHGNMWVESEPEKGSIFYFTILTE